MEKTKWWSWKLLIAALLMVVVLFSACSGKDATPTADSSAAQEDVKQSGPEKSSEPEYQFTFAIYDSAGNPFWQKVAKGAEEMAEMVNAKIDIQYGDNDPANVVNIIETAINNKVDGIGVVINIDEPYDDVSQKALDAGIPVVGFNQDDSKGADGHPRMSFVGQDFIVSGYVLGKTVIKEYGLKAGDHVVCPVEHPAAIYATRRFGGVKQAMDEIGATAELLDSGVQSAEDSMNKQIQYLLGHPETDAVICLGQLGTEVAPKAIEEAGMTIPSAGFDLSEKILKNIIAGDMLGTVDQQPYFQGSLAVYFLWANNKYALTPCNVNTGTLQLIDKNTAPDVLPLTKTYR